MANTDYWNRTLQQKLSRRRAIGGASALGASAAFLAACGGGNDEGGSGKASGIATLPTDTTKQAVKGGTMQSFMATEGLNFDAPTGTAQVNAHSLHAYSRLVKAKHGNVDNPPDGTVEGDAATSWEVAADGMQVTFKLRPGMKYEPRPPVNGRTINSADVKYSWDRFAAANPARGNWLASIVPDAPVDRLEYPDSSTVVVKLANPLGGIVRRFTTDLYVVPVEAEDKFDIKAEQRGSGPFMMTKWERSGGWEYQRNPNWYNTERPFLDGINYALISEPAVSLAQFRAKRLWWLTPNGDEVLRLKGDLPETRLMPFNPVGSGITGGYQMTLSKLPNSPLKDVRLRHAISMLIDRDGWINAFWNVSGLEKEGLPMEAAWNSTISCTAAEWLDPKANKLGEDSKWFHHDPKGAADLLRAANAFGIEQEFSYATSGFTTPDTTRKMEVVAQMLQEGGHFKLKVNGGDYTAWFQPTYLRGRGQYEGIAWTSGNMTGDDMDSQLWSFYAPGSRSDGIYSWDNVPGLEALMKNERKEVDDKKRFALVQDIQKLLAKQQPAIMYPGIATTFNMYWPWMGNAGYYRILGGTGPASPNAAQTDTLTAIWYDKAKDTRGG
ncbi:MAG TPA: ABC transporter substrate-binding protein [Dehalococcoidia bacterium]|nr:ABC transporter substrate-binding protein [Dehalococcoidia bacterium]